MEALGWKFGVTAREAPSGVPDQPYGDEETLAGARNRAAVLCNKAPHDSTSLSSQCSSGSNDATDTAVTADLVVAIEGGVGPAAATRGQAGELECFAWVCARDPHTGAESTARSASFALPPPLCELLSRGLELGDADDRLFGRVHSKQGSGTIGQLSGGALDRTAYYVQPVVCALLPYFQPDLYGRDRGYGRFLGGSRITDGAAGGGGGECSGGGEPGGSGSGSGGEA